MHKICNKYAAPHDYDYASYAKICKNMPKICKKYARYANMIFICKICTPHFADALYMNSNMNS